MSKNCPLCRTGMSPFTMDSLVLDRCESCNGVWFDARELTDYGAKMDLGRLRIRRGKGATEAIEGLSCPNCGSERLAPAEQDALAIYGCAACNGWFLSGSTMNQLERRYTEHLLTGGYRPEPEPAGEDAAGSRRVVAAIRRFFFR